MNRQELLPPHSQDDEQAVIGCMLIDPDAVLLVRDTLKPSDFYIQVCGWICEAIYQLFDSSTPVDLFTLRARLERNGREIGPDMLAGYIAIVPTSVHVQEYARQVIELAIRRQMIQTAGQMAKLAYDQGGDLPVQMDEAETAVIAIRNRQAGGNLIYPRAYMREYLDRIEILAGQDKVLAGPTTSVSVWDGIISGFEAGQLHIIAARPKMGKTGLCLQAARINALAGLKVAYFSLEMTRQQLVDRMIAAMTGIPAERLRVGRLYEQEWPLFMETGGLISETPLYLEDKRGLSPGDISARCRRLAMETGLDMVFIDYIGLMSPPRQYNGNRNAELTEISAALTRLAGDLNVPVVAASQLNRAVEQRGDKRPMLSDLRDSGSLEQDAYTVTFIYRDEYYNPDTTSRPGIAELIVAANRGGRADTVETNWHGPTTSFGIEPPVSPAIQPVYSNGYSNGAHGR